MRFCQSSSIFCLIIETFSLSDALVKNTSEFACMKKWISLYFKVFERSFAYNLFVSQFSHIIFLFSFFIFLYKTNSFSQSFFVSFSSGKLFFRWTKLFSMKNYSFETGISCFYTFFSSLLQFLYTNSIN